MRQSLPLMHFYSGKLLQFYSGVDSSHLLRKGGITLLADTRGEEGVMARLIRASRRFFGIDKESCSALDYCAFGL